LFRFDPKASLLPDPLSLDQDGVEEEERMRKKRGKWRCPYFPFGVAPP